MKIFWSWQSDHDGRISHYLVRDALQDIEEPSEAERRANLELDHDTKGETGWTDIADSIFRKIDRAAVFVGDVTPVVKSSRKEKGRRPRAIMNPNVAIELGYAIKALTWSRCLGVMNLAYGDIDDLPFDIHRTRSWPVTYALSEEAPKEEIADAKKMLIEAFCLKLRPFLAKVQPEAEERVERMPAVRPPAFWFEAGASLGTRRDEVTYTMSAESVLFLRLIPTDPKQKLIPHDLAERRRSGSARRIFVGIVRNIRRDSLVYFRMGNSELKAFVEDHQRLFVLTGAGCSTNSGIPDYRDADGSWKRTPPVRFQAFIADDATRRRYWARSMIGWRRFGQAQPNDAHFALARLEASGRSRVLLTQNVDRLHQAAGSREVIDLHGRLDLVRCMACSAARRRADFQDDLVRLNADWADLDAAALPDGDAELDHKDFSEFVVPNCPSCGGTMKPDVVFFGENVPRDQVVRAMENLEQADAMLVVGSSLMVYSGFRFVQAAARIGIPIAAVNLGRTRADGLLALKVENRCEAALSFLL